ncbi:hypothetical protein CXU22_08150 [Akkermansia muciniphila]|uniref:MarR family transcriptional regulator n=1 Tax=Akkermansia muciniphila TaxID=239935 RepID=A0A2N8HCU3_9BACT|nr:hypothetical protein [Akkermansia muciniphila]PNC17709.1 hypothetical protein CXU22_08150 [Akkermansia muciniphila]
MGKTPSLTGLELSILLYLHGNFEHSDEEITAECRGIEQESIRHAVRGLAGREFIIRTKEEEFLLRPDCWLITYAGRQALRQWVSAAAPVRRSSRTKVTA